MATATAPYTSTDADRAVSLYDSASTVPTVPHAAPTFSASQLDVIRNTIAAGTSDQEFALFMAVVQRTGLDPFSKQIYAIKRKKRKPNAAGRWETTEQMTIQTGIDGYRAIAEDSGRLAGIDDPVYDREDGDHPNWAKCTVWRWSHGQRVPFTATARWSEYAPKTTDSESGEIKYTGQWSTMPWLMLGKCAEALALRKGFPKKLSGVYTREEMDQALNDDPAFAYVEQDPQPATAPARLAAPQIAPDSRPMPHERPAQSAQKATPAQTSANRATQASKSARQDAGGMKWSGLQALATRAGLVKTLDDWEQFLRTQTGHATGKLSDQLTAQDKQNVLAIIRAMIAERAEDETSAPATPAEPEDTSAPEAPPDLDPEAEDDTQQYIPEGLASLPVGERGN